MLYEVCTKDGSASELVEQMGKKLGQGKLWSNRAIKQDLWVTIMLLFHFLTKQLWKSQVLAKMAK